MQKSQLRIRIMVWILDQNRISNLTINQFLLSSVVKKKQTETKQKPNFYLPTTKLFKNRTSKSWLNIKKKSNSFLNMFELCQAFYAIICNNLQYLAQCVSPRKLLLKTNTKCIFQINFFIFLDAGIRENFSSDFLEC